MTTDDRIVELLEELASWTRFSNRDSLIRLWTEVLADPRHLRAYELSDGTRTQRAIAESVGVSQPTVSLLWQKWRRLGLVRNQDGPARHIARPTDLGVEVPEDGEGSQGGPAQKEQTPRSKTAATAGPR